VAVEVGHKIHIYAISRSASLTLFDFKLKFIGKMSAREEGWEKTGRQGDWEEGILSLP
jgi:hypothetical protein